MLDRAGACRRPQLTGLDNWLNLDPLGKVFLGTDQRAVLPVRLLRARLSGPAQQRNNRVLCSCLMLSLAMMTLIILSHHLGLMWVAMEATTLVSAPGLYFNHNPRSLEATWKYLLICSVGIALALLGSLFLAYSALHAGLESTLMFDDLVRAGAAACRAPGCTRRSCFCSSATARRWAWRRCTPGSPTPTAKPRA